MHVKSSGFPAVRGSAVRGACHFSSPRQTHPGGTGPTRTSEIEPVEPELLPPVKLKSSFAFEQLWKLSVPVPTATVLGTGKVCASNNPPVVS